MARIVSSWRYKGPHRRYIWAPDPGSYWGNDRGLVCCLVSIAVLLHMSHTMRKSAFAICEQQSRRSACASVWVLIGPKPWRRVFSWWGSYYCCTCFSMGDLGVQVSVRPSVNIIPGCLVSATPLTVLYRSFLKLCMYFHHGIRMCMWFGYNCEIIFCHFFHFVNLVIFWPQWIDSGYLVSTTLHTILYRSFWNFGYNHCINFCHLFHFANFIISWPQILWKCKDSGYLVSTTPHTIFYWSFWNFACACGLDIIVELIFVTFSTLWTLSFSDLRFYESV